MDFLCLYDVYLKVKPYLCSAKRKFDELCGVILYKINRYNPILIITTLTMKKVFFKTMMAAVLAGAAMSSCVNEVEDLYNPEYIAKKQQYETQWRIKFGRIDQNEDWGFGTGVSDEAKAVTRGTNTNSNMWAEDVIVPADISDTEVEKVLSVFSKPIDPTLVRKLNFSDFFVQHVYGEEMNYTTVPNEKGETHELKVKLNKLSTGYNNADGSVSYDEINNFNASLGDIMLMQKSGTVGFAYSNPNDGGVLYTDDYVIVEIDGQYYVGIDYSCDAANLQVEANGIYNDWIVKIVPVEYIDTKRIICEDLGSIGDFDFNDVVFDVADAGWRWDATANANIREAIVTIHAAGGTLPIFVGGVEVHAALGVDTGVMVNTGASNGVNAVISNYRVKINEGDDVRNIPVVVESSEAGFYTLEAPQGKAPHKICVSTDFKWTPERTNIKDVYTTFPSEGWETVVAE